MLQTRRRKRRHSLTIALQPSAPQATQSVDQAINRDITILVTSFGAALLNPFVSLPLGVVATGGILYGVTGIFKEGITKVVKEREVDVQVLSTIGVTGLIVTNHLAICAFTSIMLTYGRKLMLQTQDRSRTQLLNIIGEQPKFVWLVQDGAEVELPFHQLRVNDVIIVGAGQMIPIDGTITQGEAMIDQQRLTGEAQPVEKGSGDPVLAATMVLAGRLHIRVQQTGNQTVAAQIGHILNNTIDYRTHAVLRFQQLSNRLAAPALGMSAFAAVTVGLGGSIALLTAFPAASVGLISSLNVMTFLAKSSKLGVLVKDGRALERLAQIDTVVFDKTGTLTLEEPTVGTIHICGDLTEDALLSLAASAEIKQSHPIAQAILAEASARNLVLHELERAQYELGYGLTVQINEQTIRVGSKRFIDQCNIVTPNELDSLQNRCDTEGISLVYVAVDDLLGGVIELYSTIRPEAQAVVAALQARGLKSCIISGDRAQPTQKLARQLGIEQYFAEVLPQDKGQLIEQLQADNHQVCFVGDGINDTIALKKANASVSLAGATSAATDTAQIVLLDSTLAQLPALFRLSDQFRANTNRTLGIILTPILVTTFGVFVLHTGILSAQMVFNAGFLGAVASSLLPARTASNDEANTKEAI